jgi:hypothetical protein
MASWRFAIGNAVRLSGVAPVASLASVGDTIYPLTQLGNGETDEPARWARNTSALYGADVDLNRLRASSSRADAPTGWFDFRNLAAGAPGLPANPPDFGNYGGRNPALRFFWPSAQDVDVMPGATVRVRASIYLPSTSNCTAVRLRVIDLWTGRSYDGTGNAWDDADVDVGEQTATNTWLDIDEIIAADSSRRERTRYRVLLEQDSPSFGASSFCYASAFGAAGNPALFPRVTLAAIVGHNIPRDAIVTVKEAGGSGSAITLAPEVPNFMGIQSAQDFQMWRLRVEMPAGTAAFHARPYIGELWLGEIADMTWCPSFPFDLIVEDKGQIRTIGGYGRQYVTSDAARELHDLKMKFKVNGEAGYQQVRNYIESATRFGQDPLLIMPADVLEGAGVLYHARVGNEVSYSRENNVRRSFTLLAIETPFPRVAA